MCQQCRRACSRATDERARGDASVQGQPSRHRAPRSYVGWPTGEGKSAFKVAFQQAGLPDPAGGWLASVVRALTPESAVSVQAISAYAVLGEGWFERGGSFCFDQCVGTTHHEEHLRCQAAVWLQAMRYGVQVVYHSGFC